MPLGPSQTEHASLSAWAMARARVAGVALAAGQKSKSISPGTLQIRMAQKNYGLVKLIIS
jgi:hypothetical protein